MQIILWTAHSAVHIINTWSIPNDGVPQFLRAGGCLSAFWSQAVLPLQVVPCLLCRIKLEDVPVILIANRYVLRLFSVRRERERWLLWYEEVWSTWGGVCYSIYFSLYTYKISVPRSSAPSCFLVAVFVADAMVLSDGGSLDSVIPTLIKARKSVYYKIYHLTS